MHGWAGENRKRSRHMWPVPTRGTAVTRTTADSFCKDGRKISIGDCALFKPPQDSPPFIGIIRWLASEKENNLHLGVNWLYRAAEVKLGKGILLDAPPNEVFYSFHKDEIPAASLLHPCKVAFLPKGVELPVGIPSFVCRRVYDIANKCLWWLTDQDYIDEQQEEVEKLLHKTQIEMHPTVQTGGRSPKPINGPTSTSQLKSGSDNMQSANPFSSQAKGKKRERSDQGTVPVKRERSSMTDDGDSIEFKPENISKSEISKITENGGGLVDPEGAEKLVQLMQPDRAERKMELSSRSMLASVIAATEKFDCLNRFVQLKGLSVLDEWLQDAHKGKIGDGSPKDGDKSVEEFLLVLLRALDKLPVNLHALQMCNIGKSVNHLRSHKNLEIQRKARGLVDTWKKRVEAEMNVIDTKPGSTHVVSWPSRSRLPEVSHDGNRNPGGSTEVGVKSSLTQLSASKTASLKPVESEFTKSTSSSPGATKSAVSPASGKDSHPRVVVGGTTSDLPSATAREDRSSSSSQSHNNSQCLGNGKEDPKSSTAVSMTVNKVSGGSSRHRRSINGFSGPAVSGGQKETGPSRNLSVHRNSASEKFCVSGFAYEKAFDVPNGEGNGQKLIVKIPTRGRSPGQSAGGGSVDHPSNMNSRASSPMLPEKHGQFDRSSREKIDADRSNTTNDVNTESWQSNDMKDLLTGSDEGDGSPAAIPEEERRKIGEDAGKSKFDFDSLLKLAEVSRAASSSSGNDLKSGKSHWTSSSSINALVERCVKYSDANSSVSAGDDVRINLLASVAAGEMSRSDLISLTDSPCRNTPMVEDSMGDDAKSKLSHGNNVDQVQSRSSDGAQHLSKQTSGSISGEGKTSASIREHAPTGEGNEYHSCNPDLHTAKEPCLEMYDRLDELRVAASVAVSLASAGDMVLVGDERKQLNHEATVNGASVEDNQGTKANGSCYLSSDGKVSDVPPSSLEIENKGVEVLSSNASIDMGTENNKNGNEGFDGGDHTEQILSPGKVLSNKHLERSDEDRLHNFVLSKDLPSKNDELNGGKADAMDRTSKGRQAGKQISEYGVNSAPSNEYQVLAGLGSAVSDQNSKGREANVESKDVLEQCSGGAVPQKGSPALPTTELEHHVMPRGSKMSGVGVNRTEENASIVAHSSSFTAAEASNMGSKLKFDLNEGFIADEGKCGVPVDMASPGFSSSVHLNVFPFHIPSLSSGLPASITIAAAAKGPFVPREELLRSKGEVGWKGSAATSAFRPAEPRKTLEMPLGIPKTLLPDSTAGRHGRPLLDFDLNMPGERSLEDMTCRNSDQEMPSTSDHVNNRELVQNRAVGSAPVRSSGGLVLDLNLVDEASDMGQYSNRSIRAIEAPLLPLKSSSTSGPKSEVRRDFDLNNGPVVDEASAEPFLFGQHGRSITQSQPPASGLRMNNAEMGTFSPWYPTGNTYPGVRFPSTLPDRGEHPFPIVAGGPPRMLAPPTGGTPFTSDVYRGASVLSSSPAVPFSCPVFPFGSSFPLPSANFSGGSTTYMDSSSGGRLSFPIVNSQSMGPASSVTSHYPRPYIVSLPDGSSDISIDNSRKWMRQGLDLNAGPGNVDTEGRDETLALATRQLSVARSQALAEGQARMYQQLASGVLKRKEPEGWDTENLRYKQSSWQ